jgi:hypothetical protein
LNTGIALQIALTVYKTKQPVPEPSATFAMKKCPDEENADQVAPYEQGSTSKSRRNQETDF